jgi:hypothetical protein
MGSIGGARGKSPAVEDMVVLCDAFGGSANRDATIENRTVRALGDRAHSMVFRRVDPQLAALRGEEGFGELVRKVGLP